MILLSVFTPLINFLSFALCSTLVHRTQLAKFTIVSMLFSLLLIISCGPAIIAGETYIASLGVWAVSGLFEINWNFSVDSLTYVMLIVVLTVSTLVHIYSTEYMSEDPHLPRFMSYLSLFTFFMLILITSDNFIGLFLGWEGVGLCSYLLISFWFTRVQANKAAIKAMIVNRVADLAFTVGVLAVFYVFQTVEFNVVFGLAPYFVDSTLFFGNTAIAPLTLISMLLFLGAMGKSAQIGLHTWLPDAMEGWDYLGLSSKKILPYARTASLDTLVSGLVLTSPEKSSVDEANSQETDVQLSGSSETLRKTPTSFDFSLFFAEIPRRRGQHLSDLEWLIGFAGGSGCFTVDNSRGYPCFKITQSFEDVQVLYRARGILGFGSVSVQDEGNNTWQLRVRKRTHVRAIISLFNGNIVLEKTRIRFASFVTAFNARYRENIALRLNGPRATLHSGWLAGFTDAEGCFTAAVLEKGSYGSYTVQARFVLAQQNAEKELRELAPLLSGRVHTTRDGHNLTVNRLYLADALRYFRMYPLKTKKRIALQKFLYIYRLLRDYDAAKTRFTPRQLARVRHLTAQINKKSNERSEDKVRPTE